MGVMITSSHNPAEWNGVKYKASYGGSRQAVDHCRRLRGYLDKPLPVAATPGPIVEIVDFNPPYIAAIEKFVDLRRSRLRATSS